MKRKELYDYIRTEIVNELSEAGLFTLKNPQDATKGLATTIDPDDATERSPQFLQRYKKVSETEISEMARTAAKIKVGDPRKLELAQKIYKKSIVAKLIDLIKNAGEEGMTQDELAQALNITNSSEINSDINLLVKAGAFIKPKKEITPKAEPSPAAAPSAEEDDWMAAADADEKDDWEKSEDEEETDKSPSAADIKAAERSASKVAGGKGYAKQLSPEDEEKYERLRKGIEAKIAKILALSKAKRSSSTDLEVLRTLVKRDDVKKLFKAKGVNLNDLVSDVIS